MSEKTVQMPARGRHMRGVAEKPNNLGVALVKLLEYSKSYVPAIIIALIAAAVGTVLQIVGPDRLKDMTNEIAKGLPALINGKPVFGSIDMAAVANIAWVLVAFYASSALLSFAQSYIMATVTQRMSRTMRTDISTKINRLPLRYFDKTSHGDVLSRVTNDVDAIGQSMSQSIGSLVTSITMFFGALFMMFYNSWILALTSVGASLIGFLLMMVIMKKSQRYFVFQQKNLGNINGHIEEIYSGHNVVKVYNGGKKAKKEFDEINQALYNSAWKSQFLGNFGYVAVCVVGAALTMNGTISFGVIVAFIMYVRLFTQPLSQIAQAINSLQRAAAAGERVFEFLDEAELEDENYKIESLENVKGDVEFK